MCFIQTKKYTTSINACVEQMHVYCNKCILLSPSNLKQNKFKQYSNHKYGISQNTYFLKITKQNYDDNNSNKT